MPRGGKRNGAGRPAGTLNPGTITKEHAREALRQTVLKHMDGMLSAQIAHARGIGHLYTRDKTGKFTKIENQARIDQLLLEGTEDEDYWIFSKDPSVQAFTDLMNRALDKPKEQEQELRLTGDAEFITALQRGRQRAAKR
jgi:hypothetical protein